MAKSRKKGNSPTRHLAVDVGGRPTKSEDEQKIKTICDALRLGSHLETACYLADIDPKSVRSYCAQARLDPSSVYGTWLNAITGALAHAELRDLAVIDVAAQGRPAQYLMIADIDAQGRPIVDADGRQVWRAQLDGDGKPIKIKAEMFPSWQAAAWKLERKAPKRWGRFDRIMVDDLEGFRDNPAPATEEEKIDRGEIEARARRLQKVKAVLEAVPMDTDLADV